MQGQLTMTYPAEPLQLKRDRTNNHVYVRLYDGRWTWIGRMRGAAWERVNLHFEYLVERIIRERTPIPKGQL